MEREYHIEAPEIFGMLEDELENWTEEPPGIQQKTHSKICRRYLCRIVLVRRKNISGYR